MYPKYACSINVLKWIFLQNIRVLRLYFCWVSVYVWWNRFPPAVRWNGHSDNVIPMHYIPNGRAIGCLLSGFKKKINCVITASLCKVHQPFKCWSRVQTGSCQAITVPTNVLVPYGTRPSPATMLATELDKFSLFRWMSRFPITSRTPNTV